MKTHIQRENLFKRCFLVSLITLYCFTTSLSQSTQVPSTSESVQTGIYLMNIYDLDMNAHSFHADFYLWFKWKGNRDPMNIEFVNAIDDWSFTINNFYETPKLLADGYQYNGMRIEGRFYHPFELEGFPLDDHSLSIHFENVFYPVDSITYISDTDAAFIRKDLFMPGWNINGITTETLTNTYPSDFGENKESVMGYSSFAFNLAIARPVNYFVLKLLLPLLIVILVSLGALLIHASNTDARISLPIGSLIAAIFLQQSYSAALPDVGYMVLMDKIYLIAYAIIAGVILRVIIAGNYLSSQKKQADIAAIKRKDTQLVFVFVIFLILGLVLLIF